MSTDRRNLFKSFPPGVEWQDYQFIPNANGPDLTYFNPSDTNWVGAPIEKGQVSLDGNFLTLGPAPPGWPSGIASLVLLAGFKKMAQTPEGMKVIRDIVTQYLKTLGTIISTLSQSSSAHVISCAINQYVACTIYQRMGMMSPKDALQTRAWLDHQVGEALKVEYTGQSLGALTTLVNGSSYTEGDQSYRVGGAGGGGGGKKKSSPTHGGIGEMFHTEKAVK